VRNIFTVHTFSVAEKVARSLLLPSGDSNHFSSRFLYFSSSIPDLEILPRLFFKTSEENSHRYSPPELA